MKPELVASPLQYHPPPSRPRASKSIQSHSAERDRLWLHVVGQSESSTPAHPPPLFHPRPPPSRAPYSHSGEDDGLGFHAIRVDQLEQLRQLRLISVEVEGTPAQGTTQSGSVEHNCFYQHIILGAYFSSLHAAALSVCQNQVVGCQQDTGPHASVPRFCCCVCSRGWLPVTHCGHTRGGEPGRRGGE
jgi:hypothetical protein